MAPIRHIALVITLLLLCGATPLLAKENKDVILVLDTSLSMVGYGGQDIMGEVKQSIERFIDTLNDGDRVTFLTFDSDVVVYPTVLVDDQNDRDILKKYITITEAKGKWTHTLAMMSKVFETAESLQDSSERQVVIAVMTDGLDDPPPAKRGNDFSLEAITNDYSGKDWWIYLVSFSELKENSSVKEKIAQQRLKDNLSKVSDRTRVIDASDDPGKGIEEDMAGDIQRREEEARSPILAILITLLVILLIVGILIYLYRLSQLKVKGKLIYWNNKVLNPYTEEFDLSRFGQREILIGNQSSCHLNLGDYDQPKPFSVFAERVDGAIVPALHVDQGVDFSFEEGGEKGFLDTNTVFRVGTFTFKYSEE